MTVYLDAHRACQRFSQLDAMTRIEQSSFTDPWSERMLKETLALDTVRLLTAMEGETLLGYLILSVIAPEGEILNLAVDPAQRRQGIGDRLMEACYAHCLDVGVDTLFLEVRESNAAAISLYKKKGFEAVGKRRRYYRAPLEDAVVMMKRLSSFDFNLI